LGIYGARETEHSELSDEDPGLPANVRKAFKPFENRIFADFEVCPLEPEQPGVMQSVCIAAAKNIVVEK